MKCVFCGSEVGDLKVLGQESRKTVLARAVIRQDQSMQETLSKADYVIYIHDKCRSSYVNKSNVAKAANAAALSQSQQSTPQPSAPDTAVLQTTMACMFCNNSRDGELKVVRRQGLETIVASSNQRNDGRFINLDIAAGPYYIHNDCRGSYTDKGAITRYLASLTLSQNLSLTQQSADGDNQDDNSLTDASPSVSRLPSSIADQSICTEMHGLQQDQWQANAGWQKSLGDT